MATSSEKHQKLTDYESRRMERIAAWKSQFPDPFDELIHRIAQPIANIVEWIIPDRIGLFAIEAAYKAAAAAAPEVDIAIQAGVADISELRHVSLEVCDRLSRRVGLFARGIATVEGAVTGAGGVWTTLLDVPLLFGLCMRTIIKIGHCYGYALDQPADKAWVLGAFALSLSSTRQKRIDLMARLRDIEDLLLEDTQEQVVVQEATTLLTQIELFEDIPIFGAASGALLNLLVAHKTDVTARHLFQERWLRDNGKIDTIEPALDDGKVPAMHGWSGALARAGHTTIYGLSFGAMFPVSMAAAILGTVAPPFTARFLGEKSPATTGKGNKGSRGRRGQHRQAPPASNPLHQLAPV